MGRAVLFRRLEYVGTGLPEYSYATIRFTERLNVEVTDSIRKAKTFAMICKVDGDFHASHVIARLSLTSFRFSLLQLGRPTDIINHMVTTLQ